MSHMNSGSIICSSLKALQWTHHRVEIPYMHFTALRFPECDCARSFQLHIDDDLYMWIATEGRAECCSASVTRHCDLFETSACAPRTAVKDHQLKLIRYICTYLGHQGARGARAVTQEMILRDRRSFYCHTLHSGVWRQV